MREHRASTDRITTPASHKSCTRSHGFIRHLSFPIPIQLLYSLIQSMTPDKIYPNAQLKNLLLLITNASGPETQLCRLVRAQKSFLLARAPN